MIRDERPDDHCAIRIVVTCGRFAFCTHAGLVLPGCPPEVVQALPFGNGLPQGVLLPHPACGPDASGETFGPAP